MLILVFEANSACQNGLFTYFPRFSSLYTNNALVLMFILFFSNRFQMYFINWFGIYSMCTWMVAIVLVFDAINVKIKGLSRLG